MDKLISGTHKEIYRQIFSKIQDGLLIISKDFEILSFNEKFTEWFPQLNKNYGNKKCYQVIMGKDNPCDKCPIISLFDSGETHHEILNSPYDKEDNEFELSSIPLNDSSSNTIIAVAQVFHNLKEIKGDIKLRQAMNMLRREKKAFEVFFHKLPYPMYMKDRNSKFLMINQAFADKFNFKDRNELVGKTDFDLFTEEHAKPAYEDEQEIMATGEAKIGYEEKERTHDNMLTYCLSTKMPVYNHDGNITGILGISVDITNRKKIENQLVQNLKEIKLINKKLENYSFTISHDLKEPIRSIRTFAEFINEDYADQFDDEAADYFKRIIRASEKMAMMIDDLLILSRIGRIDTEFEDVSVSKIINRVKDTLQQLIKESGTVIESDDLPVITCQPVWINALFQNLISNSIKYCDKPNPHIQIKYEEEPDYHIFSFKDNGQGISEDQFEKVFGLFRKAHQNRNTEGSGAGLAIVSDVIEQHHGKVWVAWSELGKGTEIKFKLKKDVNYEL